MATIDDLVLSGVIEGFELPEWEARGAVRPLHMTPGLFEWGDDKPELHDPRLAIGRRTLFEHFIQFLCDVRCAAKLGAGNLRRLMPTREGILSLHPPGLRLYGWCCAPHSLILVTGALESETKTDRRLNDLKRDEVRRFTRQHNVSHTILRGDIRALFP